MLIFLDERGCDSRSSAVKAGYQALKSQVIGPFEGALSLWPCRSRVEGESTAVCVSRHHMASRTHTQPSRCQVAKAGRAYGTHFEDYVLPRAKQSFSNWKSLGEGLTCLDLKTLIYSLFYCTPSKWFLPWARSLMLNQLWSVGLLVYARTLSSLLMNLRSTEAGCVWYD